MVNLIDVSLPYDEHWLNVTLHVGTFDAETIVTTIKKYVDPSVEIYTDGDRWEDWGTQRTLDPTLDAEHVQVRGLSPEHALILVGLIAFDSNLAIMTESWQRGTLACITDSRDWSILKTSITLY